MKKIIKISIIIFLYISAFFVFGSKNEGYNEYLANLNWFSKLTVGTFMEGVRYLDYILPSGYAYFTYMTIGIFFLYPVGNIVMKMFVDTLRLRKRLLEVRNEDYSEFGDKAQQVKVNRMIDVLEESNFSLLRIFESIIMGTLGIFFWTTALSSGTGYFGLMNKSSNFLWFDLIGGDWLYIIPGILLLIQGVQIIKYKGTRAIKWFKILISLSTTLILLPSILFSSLFGIFLLLNNLYFYIARKVSEIKNEKENKQIVSSVV